LWVGGLVGLLALIGMLTIASFIADANDSELAKRQAASDNIAAKARALATSNGVPATGALDVFSTTPMWRARRLYAQRCRNCHDRDSKDRKGPLIEAGHASRGWFEAFLKTPSGDAFWGRTKLAKTDDAMKPVEHDVADLAALVELLYAQTGASDAKPDLMKRGRALFAEECTDCHTLEDGIAGQSAPALFGVGSRDWYTAFIGNPKSAVHMGADRSEMPRFDKELSIVERDALAEYLVWLRTATPQDVAALGEP
jgi:mono/diheme cytochrome c family protein